MSAVREGLAGGLKKGLPGPPVGETDGPGSVKGEGEVKLYLMAR